jgi:hypothetical protein
VKLLYKPFGLAMGALGGLLAGMVFKRIWRVAGHDDDTPNATDRDRGWSEVVLAAALEGAVFGSVKAIIDRAGAAGFAHATGVWPGDDETTK